ncbi:hypothetical protein BgAZ_108080 [Babesia gibsoni]|uniref:rRNA-processing protein FYV7 n=1 Tax=Babesia gibsoni TaxID=33632 RepID=A0AAD8PGL0_BABGI|nr:hypothetical protein BgAZ_108080 [Babesia gibsoni]
MAKTPKVKGYGAYWKGDIKNKTIARKNKQYISDQRCLRVYKKQLHKQYPNDNERNDAPGKNQSLDEAGPSAERTSDPIADYQVKVIKPKVETLYYVAAREDHRKAKIKDGGSGNHFKRDLRESESSGHDSDGSGQSDSDEVDDDEQSEDDEIDSHLRDHVGDGRTRRGIEKANSLSDNKQKFTGVYGKALKKKHEKLQIKKQLNDERVNKIKQKKREIREKKQERYARHRLLGSRTKRGQPIMANVISHLMNKFQKKHKMDE